MAEDRTAASSSLTEHERDWLLKMPCWSTVRGAEVLAKVERLEAENERLRTLIEQAAAEANHGELTDGTLASMTEVSEGG